MTGAATATPGVPATVSTVSADSPDSLTLSRRRSARPAISAVVRAIDRSRPAFVARPATRTPTPSAIAAKVSDVRPGRAMRLRQAYGIRPRIGSRRSESELLEPRDQRSRRVVRPAAEPDLVADPPIADHEHPVGVGRCLRVVRHEDDRLVTLDARAPEGVEDLAARRVVEVPCRLVREQGGRSGDERPRDCDPLLLPRRQLVRPVTLLAGEVDESDGVTDPFRGLTGARVAARDRERKPDVLGHVEQRDQVERLEDEAGPLGGQRGCRAVGEPADDLALEDDVTGRRLVEPAEELEQRALARSGRTHERDELTLANRERDPAQRVHGRAVEGVLLGQIAGREDRRATAVGADVAGRRRDRRGELGGHGPLGDGDAAGRDPNRRDAVRCGQRTDGPGGQWDGSGGGTGLGPGTSGSNVALWRPVLRCTSKWQERPAAKKDL